MAKVIRATPTLVGEDALIFLENMKKKEKVSPSKSDLELLEIIKTHRKQFRL